MKNNILIVEGKEDKAFLNSLLNVVNITGVEIAEPPKVEIKELGGLSKEALKKQVGSIIPRIAREGIDKLGIIIDLDTDETNGGFQKRLNLVNESIEESFQTISNIPKFSATNQFIKIAIDQDTEIELACFFIHLNGKGELEDLLRETKIYNSPHADCLETWRACLKNVKIEKTDKEINKLWLHYLIRYDICTLKEQENASKYCNLEFILNDSNREGKIFNFNHNCLQELKDFLFLFKK